jgi:hypothetical protein
MEERDYTNCGRKQNQRLKPYLILQILMRESDANHVLSSKELANKLADWGIEGARHRVSGRRFG